VSPLKQLQAQIPASDIECVNSYKLVVKLEDDSPACVKPETATKLVEQGWAKEIITHTNSESNIKSNTKQDLPQEDDAASGLKLSLFVGPSTVHSGQPVSIDVILRNTLSTPLIVPVQNNWKINATSLDSCTTNPVGLAILRGYYTEENNMTGGKQLLYDNPVTCPYVLYCITSYQFEPLSSHAKSADCTIPPYSTKYYTPVCSIETSRHFSIKWYWDYDGTFHTFEPGNYTVVVADEWGRIAVQHFTVTDYAKG
jgi:hypothetical protein